MESPQVKLNFIPIRYSAKNKTLQIHFNLNNTEEIRNKLHNLSVTWNEAI